MSGNGDEIPTRDWIWGIAVVAALIAVAILIVVVAINAHCNCLTPA